MANCSGLSAHVWHCCVRFDSAAKERIRAMEYRYVEEADQNRQALLEIYCAAVLGTPYNDFGTH